MDYCWRPDETNLNGLTWPRWFYAAGHNCYSVDAGYSPVLIRHEKLFNAWRNSVDPTEYNTGELKTYSNWNKM